MKLTSSQIKYLFAISELKNNGLVRSLDIADKLNVSKPSVHRMLAQLAKKDLVSKQRYSFVELTETGTYVVEKYFKFYANINIYLSQKMCLSSSTAKEGTFALLGELNNEMTSELCEAISKIK